MAGVLVDSCVLLDLFLNDPVWSDWSNAVLDEYGGTPLFINGIVYAEVSIGFERIEDLERALETGGFSILDIPKEALFLAGKAFYAYRKRGGTKRTPLSDFFIGAQAAVLEMKLITRDQSRYRTYFPTVEIVAPQTH
jgi:predicted nucleic acid-binding protein